MYSFSVLQEAVHIVTTGTLKGNIIHSHDCKKKGKANPVTRRGGA
jgi:hypothetical protein